MTNPIKPRLRNEADVNIRSSLVHGIYKLLTDEKHYPFQSCLVCTQFKEADEFCLKYQAKPPARVIVFGCPSFDDVTEIPF